MDVGCGKGIIGALSRIYREPSRLVGVDIFEPYIEFCRKMNLYDELIGMDLRELPLPFSASEFDVVTCVEVVEHLPKGDAIRLLEELERVGNLVVITTPSFFCEQGHLDGNPYQEHVSSWQVRDFTRRGYEVEGVGPMRTPRIFGRAGRYAARVLEPFTRRVPSLSGNLLCTKRVSHS